MLQSRNNRVCSLDLLFETCLSELSRRLEGDSIPRLLGSRGREQNDVAIEKRIAIMIILINHVNSIVTFSFDAVIVVNIR